jgi:hypothetical protein
MWLSARSLRIALLAGVSSAVGSGGSAATASDSVGDYPSIQEALDRNPGRRLFVPAGDHVISDAVRIHTDHGGLWGPGRIVSRNSGADIIVVENASDVQVRDVILARAEGRQDTDRAAVAVSNVTNVVLSGLTIADNWTSEACIRIRNANGVQVRECSIRDYCRIAVDDRRRNPTHPDYENYGYAFNCIAGNGLIVSASTAVAIVGNRIIETRLLPTPESKARYHLGQFIARDSQKGRVVPQSAWDAGYVNNWNQSRGMGVTTSNGTDWVQILGNYIENAGQGVDLHCDHVILAQNIVNNSHIGMKAMHGARNVLVLANQFVKSDLWSINLMPGTQSTPAMAADGKHAASGANIDGHSIVASNIISDFGYGNAHWIWGDSAGLAPIRFNAAPLPENPVFDGVIVDGNVVLDTGRDGVIVDGKPRTEPPRYAYAIYVATGVGAPRDVKLSHNLLHPGTKGTSNIAVPATP